MDSRHLTEEQRARLLDRITKDAVFYHRLVQRMEQQQWPRSDHVFACAELAAQRLQDLRTYVELIGKNMASGAK